MFRLKVALLALITAVAFGATTGVASASVSVGPNCTLTADNPQYSGNYVAALGAISCSNPGAPQNVTLQTCLEKNTGSGWSGGYNCQTTTSSSVSYIQEYSYSQAAGCGTWFRTWTWADEKIYYAWTTDNYTNAVIGNANYLC